MNIDILKKMRSVNQSRMNSALEKGSKPLEKGGKPEKDTRFWELTRDKAGNGFAVIRFLPNTIKEIDGEEKSDELPWVKIFNHGFQGPTGKWYIENSLSTFNEKDPCGELNQRLWHASEDDKSPQREQARKQKRKLNYFCNILVVDDPSAPENNGQVFMFKFGKSIFDIINDAANPTYLAPGQKAIKPFDYWEGANFTLRSRTADGYIKYDRSMFDRQSPIADSDEEILDIAKRQYLLSELLDRKFFKTYDELAKKLAYVLDEQPANNNKAKSATAIADSYDSDDEYTEPAKKVAQPAKVPLVKIKPTVSKPANDEDDDEFGLAYFEKMAQGD